MHVSARSRSRLHELWPVLVALMVAWVVGRGLKRMAWRLIGLVWLVHWTGGLRGWMHMLF